MINLQIYEKKSIMPSPESGNRTKNFSDYEIMSISFGFLYFLFDRKRAGTEGKGEPEFERGIHENFV